MFHKSWKYRNINSRIKKSAQKTAIFMGVVVALGGLAAFTDGSVREAASVGTASKGIYMDDDEDVEISVDVTGNGEGYSSILFDNTNGLPTAEANAIAETSEGFIWIGSYGGLIRYDGNTFERMDSTDGIASVVTLFVDSRNRLWVGTNDSGVAVMEMGETRMFNKADGLKSASIRSITEDNDGNIYLATTDGLAKIDTEMNLTMVQEPGIKDENIREIKMGSDGLLYGVTLAGSIFLLENGSLKYYYTAEEMNIENARCIMPDRKNRGCVYLGTQQSEIYHVKMVGGLEVDNEYDTSPLSYINSMKVIGGQMWICADNGVGILEKGEVHLIDTIPVESAAEAVMADYQGNLWFASSKQGVVEVVPNRFTDIFAKYGLSPSVVNSTCMVDNVLYIGDKNNGLTAVSEEGVIDSIPITSAEYASGEKIESEDLLELLNGCRIRSIICDKEKRLWISTFSDYGIVRYDQGKVKCFTEKDGLPSNRVRTVYEKEDGSFMVACTGGMAIINEDKVQWLYTEKEGIDNTEILSVTESHNGDMIVGTDGGGIYIINKNSVMHLGTEDGLASEVIMRVKKDRSRDIYWIVTSNSIAYMDGDYHITTINNFPYSNNFDMYENTSEDMWILSSNGIYVVPVEELLRNEEINPEYFNSSNGLQYITTANSYSALTEGGDLYISGSTGVSMVNIDKPFENVGRLKMAVPFVDADGQYIYPDENGVINIPADVNKVTIYGYVYTYSLTNPQVTYKLNGFDKNRVTVDRNELAPLVYTNLKGGKYTFTMKLSDSMGIGTNELVVKIVKRKKVYEQVWFIALILLAVASLVEALIRLLIVRKMEALQKKEHEQRILIREITTAFAKVIDMKDSYTNGHSTRVADYTAMLAKELGYNQEEVDKFYNIALLHDIGKIGIPKEVLNKNGKLEDWEFNLIKSHSSLGYETLKGISIMPELAIGAKSHHERPDGKGYPNGLKGDEIPRVAQIIAVADTFDAMYSDRPYRKRMNFDKAVSIIKEVSGTQLTSDVVDAFLRLVERGEFRDENDDGGGTTEDINNIHKQYEAREAVKKADEAKNKAAEAKNKEMAEEKPEEKSDDKSEGKSDDKSEEKSDDKSE